MVIRTFLDKSTTIVESSIDNFGLNPVLFLTYGEVSSRCLIHFDVAGLRKRYEDGEFAADGKTRHILKMRNCGNVNDRDFHKLLPWIDSVGAKQRASSFDLILFKVPLVWDRGVGFDNSTDFWLIGDNASSTNGCNWFQAHNGKEWDDGDGIYTSDFLSKEYEKYGKGEKSIIIGRQHFDHGNENLEIDVTDYVFSLLEDDSENYGLCLAFSPLLESTQHTWNETTELVKSGKYAQYVGFFNEKTNTLYEPVVETRCGNVISDDRNYFYLKKKNKLYFYSRIGGVYTNLDEMPVCTISGQEYPVVREGRGIYSVTLTLDEGHEADEILYDEWSNLKFKGVDLGTKELRFVTLPASQYFTFDRNQEIEDISPTVSGINDAEKLTRGERRMVKVIYRIPYTSSKFKLVRDTYYRLYVNDGDRECTVIDWDRIESADEYNFFYISPSELVPAKYHVDIKAVNGEEVKFFKDVLDFTVVSEVQKQKI